MKKYYFTYPMNDRMPFRGGWTTIHAESEQEARNKHKNKYGLSDSGCLRFAFCYSEEEWKNTSMNTDGNFDIFEHEVIE